MTIFTEPLERGRIQVELSSYAAEQIVNELAGLILKVGRSALAPSTLELFDQLRVHLNRQSPRISGDDGDNTASVAGCR